MDSLESTGKILEQARKDQGKSIPDMEGLTKIRGRFLQALEDDQFGVLPGDVYVRGFLRTYANTLHLDAEALIAKYKEDLSSVP
ncbi:MAG: helix-turn-helix domain-containing protein, partial [Terriglobia bacterium]